MRGAPESEYGRGQKFLPNDEQALQRMRTAVVAFMDALERNVVDPQDGIDLQWLERTRWSFGNCSVVPVHHALHETFAYLDDAARVADWGAGRVHYHPIPGQLSKAKFYLIEAQEQEIRKAVAKKVSFRTATVVPKSQPPYDEIPDGTLDGVMSITALHMIPEDMLHRVVDDLLKKLRPGGKICHIQDGIPAYKFLVGLTSDRWQKIEQYLRVKDRYRNLSGINVTRGGGFWGTFLDSVSSEVQQSVVAHFGSWDVTTRQLPPWAIPPLVGVQEVLRDSERNLQIIAQQRTGRNMPQPKTSKEITEYIRNGAKSGGVRGILGATSRLLKIMTDMKMSVVADKKLGNWYTGIGQVVSGIQVDVFEAYLTTVLLDHGLDVEDERVVTQLTLNGLGDAYRAINFHIDGNFINIPNPEPPSEAISSVRRIVATVKA